MNRVFVFSPDTLEQVMYFNSVAEAAKALNEEEYNVRRYALKTQECGPWIISYLPEVELERYIIKDETGKIVAICKSLREAAVVIGCSHESVRLAAKHHRPTKGRTVEHTFVDKEILGKFKN